MSFLALFPVLYLASLTLALPAPDATPANPSGIVSGSITATPAATGSAASCVITTTIYPTTGTQATFYQSAGISGTGTYCSCGPTMAGLNLATSGSSTTTYCATGGGVPAGFTQIPADADGHPMSASGPQPSAGASGQCSDGSSVDSSCFNELDLPDFLTKWWSDNQGKCDGLQFADCFYKVETKYAPSDCQQINGDAACTQPKWSDFQGTTNGIQRFYVAWNIFNTNGFFLDMYNAIGNGEQKAQAGLGQVISVLDPPKPKQSVALEDVLLAFTFALSLYAEGSVLVKALIRSAPQTTGLLGKLFEPGTIDSTVETWQDVSGQLGQVTSAYQNSVAQGLGLLQNDVQQFTKWSQQSGLSGNRPGLNDLSNSMASVLNAFAIGRVIDDIGLVVTRAPNTDVHALMTNGSKLNWNPPCQGDYDSNGICGEYYWDGTDTFAITEAGHMKKTYGEELASLIGGSTPLTTGKLLFSAAQGCYARTGKNGGDSPASPSINQQDPTDMSCVSTMRVCTWDEGSYGPFDKSCPNLPDKNAALPWFGVSGCIGDDPDGFHGIDVPVSYLGPGVYENSNNVKSLDSDTWCNNVDY